MLRSLLAPRMLASHLLVLAVMAGCVLAGSWQWDRLQSARAANDLAEARMQAEPVDLAELDGDGLDTDALEHRRVTATGTFRPAEEVLQRNRGHQGNQGLHVLTPLELADGTPVLVRRGWVPTGLDGPPVAEAPPPEGPVEVTGLLERSVSPSGFGAQDPEDGELEQVFHADVGRLDRQVDGELFPMVVRLFEPAPSDGELPLPVGPPELDEANHFSYAIQWYSFALLAGITYAVWLVRRQRGSQGGAPGAPTLQATGAGHADATLPGT